MKSKEDSQQLHTLESKDEVKPYLSIIYELDDPMEAIRWLLMTMQLSDRKENEGRNHLEQDANKNKTQKQKINRE
jgi:hypothetical protein